MDPISSFSTLWKQVYEADKINVEKSDDGSRCMKVQDNSHYKNDYKYLEFGNHKFSIHS